MLLKSFILIFLVSLIKSSNWNEDSLLDYIKQKYLSIENFTNLKYFHYMIVDPNEYLKYINLDECKNNLEIIYKEFNITTLIYIVNATQKNTNLNYGLKSFSLNLFHEISKNNTNFDAEATISLILIIEEKRMNLRLGDTCRKVLYDLDALKILKKRQRDLENKKFEKLFTTFTKDFITQFRQNYHIIKYNKGMNSLKKIIMMIFILIVVMIFLIIIYLIFYDKSKKVANTEIVITNKTKNELNTSFTSLKNNEKDNFVINEIISNNYEDEDNNENKY